MKAGGITHGNNSQNVNVCPVFWNCRATNVVGKRIKSATTADPKKVSTIAVATVVGSLSTVVALRSMTSSLLPPHIPPEEYKIRWKRIPYKKSPVPKSNSPKYVKSRRSMTKYKEQIYMIRRESLKRCEVKHDRTRPTLDTNQRNFDTREFKRARAPNSVVSACKIAHIKKRATFRTPTRYLCSTGAPIQVA